MEVCLNNVIGLCRCSSTVLQRRISVVRSMQQVRYPGPAMQNLPAQGSFMQAHVCWFRLTMLRNSRVEVKAMATTTIYYD